MEHWDLREKARDLLESDKGVEIRVNRSIMAEGSFAQMKGNNKLRRFSSFGMERAFTEWLLMALAVNVKHYANRRYNSETAVLTRLKDYHTAKVNQGNKPAKVKQKKKTGHAMDRSALQKNTSIYRAMLDRSVWKMAFRLIHCPPYLRSVLLQLVELSLHVSSNVLAESVADVWNTA